MPPPEHQTDAFLPAPTRPSPEHTMTSPFATGDRVGCYELVRHIHSGGFGHVWIGRHLLLRDRCAVKVFRDDGVGNVELEGVRRYKAVADMQTGLVPVHEVGLVPGKGYYYTMPLADDVNGRAVVRDASEYEPLTLKRYREMHRPVPIDRVLAVALHLLPSLHALHEAGLVHRDVKPGNIVRVEGTWKCCDVGLLARRDEIREGRCGTDGYRPPEGVFDRRADLFAFGKTLYLLATDYKSDCFEEFMAGKATIPGTDDRREALQQVIQRACHDDPNRRFQTALEMHQAINRLVRTTKLTITLDDDFASFTQARLDEFVKAVRERGFNIQGIPVCEKGSVRITLTLMPDEAEKLAAAVNAGMFVQFRAVRAEFDQLQHPVTTLTTSHERSNEEPATDVPTPHRQDHSDWSGLEKPEAEPGTWARDAAEDELPTPFPEGVRENLGSQLSARLLLSAHGYDLLVELGRGGLATIYRARQACLNRIVAVKVVPDTGYTIPYARLGAEAHARVRHPNVVQIFEFGEQDGTYFISMELCAGGSLSEKLRAGPMPPHETASLVETLARAMHASHQVGVVHRNLKPGVVLYTEDGTPKITNFLLARNLDEPSLEMTGQVLGTPAYMAPEQALGKVNEHGPACDIYSLGVILYQCLTGRLPFQGDTHQLLYRVINEEPIPPSHLLPHCPRDLEAICLKCLAKIPQDRYPSAAHLAEDLRSYLDGRGVSARQAHFLERLWRQVRRHPWQVAVVVLSVVVVGLVLWLT